MGIEMNMIMAVFLLVDLVCIFMLRRNLYKLYMKNENGRMQLAEIKKWEAIYYTRPTYYEIKVEYVENGEKKRKTIITSSSFLKKYKNEKYIRIVTIPGTDFVFPEEERWSWQNIELRIIIVIISGFISQFLFIGCIEILSIRKAYCIIFLLFLLMFLLLWRGKAPQIPNKHKTRMKYLTNLPCEEVIERLRQGTDGNFKLEKEKEDIKDKIYILSMNENPNPPALLGRIE